MTLSDPVPERCSEDEVEPIGGVMLLPLDCYDGPGKTLKLNKIY
jgi:hypothetical protein